MQSPDLHTTHPDSAPSWRGHLWTRASLCHSPSSLAWSQFCLKRGDLASRWAKHLLPATGSCASGVGFRTKLDGLVLKELSGRVSPSYTAVLNAGERQQRENPGRRQALPGEGGGGAEGERSGNHGGRVGDGSESRTSAGRGQVYIYRKREGGAVTTRRRASGSLAARRGGGGSASSPGAPAPPPPRRRPPARVPRAPRPSRARRPRAPRSSTPRWNWLCGSPSRTPREMC